MEFTRGDTKKYKFQRKDINNNVIELESQKVWFTVKDNVNTNEILIEKTLDNGMTFDDEFYYHILIEHEDTKDLEYKSYVCDIQVENDGVVTTIYHDYLTLTSEVTFKGGDYEGIVVIPEEEEQVINVENEAIVINTSGTSDYNELVNKPQINSVELQGNKTLDELGIQAKGDYALSEDVNAQISELQEEIPTKVSQLTNDAGYITAETDPTVPTWVKGITEDNISNWNNKSNFSGSYDDLTDKPTIPTTTSQLINDSGFIDVTVDNLENYTLTEDLSDVATSGSYNDLSNQPTIPTNTSQLTNDSDFTTKQYVDEQISGISGGGGNKDIEKLWTNPTSNPSGFNSNMITLNALLGNYDFITIYYIPCGGANYERETRTFKVGQNNYMVLEGTCYNGNNVDFYKRYCYSTDLSTRTLYWAPASAKRLNDYEHPFNNTALQAYAIPVEIYGIKVDNLE